MWLIDSDTQQDWGHRVPLKVRARKQHCPVGATHMNGPPHCSMDITVIPAAPATPTSPRPPRTGVRPPTRLPVTPVAARRAKPPETTGKFTGRFDIRMASL